MKELEELISKWRGVAKAPPYTADDEVESGVLIACADELEALLPTLDQQRVDHDAALREEIVALYHKMNGQEPGDEDDAFVRAALKREKR